MTTKPRRAALYLRVSTSGQTTENQRRVLAEVAERRGWTVTGEYEDAGISGAKGRDQRPAFDRMMKDASRRRFDLLMVWSIDRLGRSTATVATAMKELDDVGVAVYADKEGVDATTAHGRAMIQMAAVFGELEREMIVGRIKAGIARVQAEQRVGKVRRDAQGRLKKAIGRPRASDETLAAIRARLALGEGMVKVAKALGVGVSTVQRAAKDAALPAASSAAQ